MTDTARTEPGTAGAAEITARAAEIRSLRVAASTFWRFGSPRAMAVGLVVAIVARLSLALSTGWTRWDLVAVAMVAALIPFVEWFIHLAVLHSKPRQVRGMLIDPGAGHRQHHLNPSSLDWVLLRAVDASVFQIINAGVVVVVVGGPLWLAGAALGAGPGADGANGGLVGIGGPVVTGIVVAVVGLLHYEWSHFLFHMPYRPKTRYYRRLSSNHRLHHWRNERYWLGITSNIGDRLLRTYPASRSAVELSPTARSLGAEPPVDSDRGASPQMGR